MRVHLTTPIIEKLEPPEDGREKMIFDGECLGLVLRVQRKRDGVKKIFGVRYQFDGQPRQYQTLGHFKTEIDLQQARERARDIRNQAKRGIHPRIATAEEAGKSNEWLSCPTFSQFAENFIKEKINVDDGDRARDKTLKEIERYLTGPLSEPFKPLRLRQISRRMIAEQMAKIAQDSEANAKGWHTYLRQLFKSAQDKHAYVEANPAEGLSPPSLKARERTLEPAELAALWKATAGDDDYSKIVRLIVLLGGRRREEVGGMRWSEIDLKANAWLIPPERHKTGRKTNQPIVLPLLAEALEILRSIPREAGRDAVFGKRANGFTLWTPGKRKLDERLSLEEWHLHDLRRTAASLMGDIGIEQGIVQKLTNHVGKDGRGVFGKHYDKSKRLGEKTEALRKWTDYVLRIAGDNVVKLKAA
jgi:integrase